MDGLSADQGRDIADLPRHAVALIPVPVGDGVIAESSVRGITDEGAEQEHVHTLGHVAEGDKSLQTVEPYRGRHYIEVKEEQARQHDDHHDPVGPLEGPFGAPSQG